CAHDTVPAGSGEPRLHARRGRRLPHRRLRAKPGGVVGGRRALGFHAAAPAVRLGAIQRDPRGRDPPRADPVNRRAGAPGERPRGDHAPQPPAARPTPRRARILVAAGLSHTGFGAGGAIGGILADWLVDGEPPHDVTELNVRRFGPVYADRAYAAERARESYRYYYMLRYPHDENEWARERRLSPLDGRL